MIIKYWPYGDAKKVMCFKRSSMQQEPQDCHGVNRSRKFISLKRRLIYPMNFWH